MIGTQKAYSDYLDQVQKNLDESSFPADIVSNFGLTEINEEIVNCEFLIPVICAFSSGKSSLINSF